MNFQDGCAGVACQGWCTGVEATDHVTAVMTSRAKTRWICAMRLSAPTRMFVTIAPDRPDDGTGAVMGCVIPGDHPERCSGAGTAFQFVSMLELAALPTAIACARLHAVNVLHEWGLRNLADDAALVVSELMTNALNASVAMDDRPPIALGLRAMGRTGGAWSS